MQDDHAPRGPYTWRQRAFVGVPLLLVTAALLVACGGGTGDGTSQASSTEEMKTAQAVSASSTASVPSGWTGRAPKMEVINGITVPPEPAPSVNNATLAGVDVNGNGVRDDVERKIAARAKSISDYSKYLLNARVVQNKILGTTTTDQEKKSAYCSIISGIVDENFLSKISLDSAQRYSAYMNNLDDEPAWSCE